MAEMEGNNDGEVAPAQRTFYQAAWALIFLLVKFRVR